MNQLDFDPAKYRGYGSKPLPDALDFAVVSDLSAVRLTGADGPMTSRSRAADSVLEAFAERAASLAVRTRQSEWIKNGVVALCATSTSSDRREAAIVLCLLHDAAKRLGLSPGGMFSEGLFLKRDLIESFLRRDEKDQSITSMGYVTGADNDGFRYVRTW